MKQLRTLLPRIGILPRYHGYDQTVAAIRLINEHLEYLHQLTTVLYPAVGRLFNRSGDTVRHNIGHVIQVAWDTNRQAFSHLFLSPIKQQPTVGDFLCALHAYLGDTTHGETE